METFSWLGCLSVLLETVEQCTELMGRKVTVAWLRGGVLCQQALPSEGVEPTRDGAE